MELTPRVMSRIVLQRSSSGWGFTGTSADAGYHLQQLSSTSFKTVSGSQSLSLSHASTPDLPADAAPPPAGSAAQDAGPSQPSKRRQLLHVSAPAGGAAEEMTIARRAAATPSAGRRYCLLSRLESELQRPRVSFVVCYAYAFCKPQPYSRPEIDFFHPGAETCRSASVIA